MDLEEKIKLGVDLKITKEVTETIDELLSHLIEKDINLIKSVLNDNSDKHFSIAAIKMETHLTDLSIKIKRERVEAFDKWKDNQEKIRSADIETKEAYLHKRISEKAKEALAKEKEQSPKVYTRDEIPYITQIPEEDVKRIEAKSELDDNYIELLDN